jgi:hypothetical protein
MDRDQANEIRKYFESQNPIRYRCAVILATHGLYGMTEFIIKDRAGTEQPARKWWDTMSPRLKLIAIVEAHGLCATQGLLPILMPQVITELERDGDTDVLDMLCDLGVIVQNRNRRLPSVAPAPEEPTP